MSASIERMSLTLRTSPLRREGAAALARDLRSALPDAFGAAATASARGEAGVVLVPRMHVTLRGRLGALRGRDLARTLADACFDAAVKRSTRVRTPADDGSAAQQIVDALRAGESVRCTSQAQAAAAWLVALLLDDPGMLRSFAPFADLRDRSSGAAFAQICVRLGDAGGVIRALGRRWSLLLASRCSESDARRVLSGLTDAGEPAADTWSFLAARLAAGEGDAGPYARRVLSAAIDGTFAQQVGIAAAARTLLAAAPGERRPPALAAQAPQASNLTGAWLLWAHLGPHIGAAGELQARAIALALAERVGGALAADDPALTALCDAGHSLRDLRAALPSPLDLDRLTVSVVRDFARTLRHFERARCGYVLRAILNGPGTVCRTADGWSGTLPRSPLRTILERATLLGPLAVPWQAPTLTLVRDDD
jgi:hypothetical protein